MTPRHPILAVEPVDPIDPEARPPAAAGRTAAATQNIATRWLLTQPASEIRIPRTAAAIRGSSSDPRNDRACPPFRRAHYGPQVRDRSAPGGRPCHLLKGLAKGGNIEHLLDRKLLQLRVLLLQGLSHSPGNDHATELGLPIVVASSEIPRLRGRGPSSLPRSCCFVPGIVWSAGESCSLHLSVLLRAGR